MANAAASGPLKGPLLLGAGLGVVSCIVGIVLERATLISVSAFLYRVVTYDRDRYYTSLREESAETMT